jgi:hemerythrin superfamily protein
VGGDKAATFVREGHEWLEVLYTALLEAYRHGDWADVSIYWQELEGALRAHMDEEEKQVFPVFRAVEPAEAAALKGDHDALRGMLELLAFKIERRSLTEADAQGFVRRLRAHGTREERVLHPWIDATRSTRSVVRFEA